MDFWKDNLVGKILYINNIDGFSAGFYLIVEWNPEQSLFFVDRNCLFDPRINARTLTLNYLFNYPYQLKVI